jgi:hypothetical protein
VPRQNYNEKQGKRWLEVFKEMKEIESDNIIVIWSKKNKN